MTEVECQVKRGVWILAWNQALKQVDPDAIRRVDDQTYLLVFTYVWYQVSDDLRND